MFAGLGNVALVPRPFASGVHLLLQRVAPSTLEHLLTQVITRSTLKSQEGLRVASHCRGVLALTLLIEFIAVVHPNTRIICNHCQPLNHNEDDFLILYIAHYLKSLVREDDGNTF